MRMRVTTLFLVLGVTLSFQVPQRSQTRRLTALSLAQETTPALLGDSTAKKPVNPFAATNSRRIQHRDAVIVGGGLAGLSVALFLSQMDPSRHITIYDRDDPVNRGKTSIASFAAAGMLAPQSERLPKGYLLDICMDSRRMYGDFCDLVETLARESGEDGKKYLADSAEHGGMDPWNVGYMAQGGFLAPAFAGDTVATWAPPEDSGSAMWLDATQARELEPNLHPDVVGGWWFPEDASVDAVRLTGSLRAACVAAGVQIQMGPDYEVNSLDLVDGECRGLWLQNGKYIKAKSLCIANGAWMRTLLPVPIEPHKGQSLSLRMPPDQPPMLRRVLFAQDSYIVPKADGRIIIGATVEAGSYDPNITPAGILHILTHALQLLPGLKDLPIEQTWAGLRPTTPDKGPILGKTPWENLVIAGGYWRNGVLLAPKTGQLLASVMSGLPLSAKDETLLQAFSWDRFTNQESSTALAASTRYAASMHPIHSRKSGSGVAAAVGTELGSYSSARAAREERKLDRESLFQSGADDGRDDAFEKAAALGTNDASAFVFGDIEKPAKKSQPEARPFEGTADAYTVGSSSENTDMDSAYKAIQENKSKSDPKMTQQDEDTKADPGFPISYVDPESREETEVPPYTPPGEFLAQKDAPAKDEADTDLSAAYKAIQENKAKASPQMTVDDNEEAMAEPGFRIFYVDPETREKIEVPPYTSPGDFFASRKTAEITSSSSPSADKAPAGKSANGKVKVVAKGNDYSEKTYDGYQDIQQANSSADRGEELKAMRIARQKNRLGSDVDVSVIGASAADDDDDL